jgi:FkbH-like protein
MDLDNTLWGGIVGEDGVAGIKLGGDATGEAFLAFQSYILQLKEKGVILAVCSKNNEEDARAAFQAHPEMRLKLDDFAVFVANWEPKAENLIRIARTLNLGLDALVFVDDNPVECATVRRALPEVDVIALPADPAYYVRTLSRYLNFETATLTEEDKRRGNQYQARAHAEEMKQAAGSLEEMWEALDMNATIEPFDEMSLPRVLQLIGKTNQFNLTTRRHGLSEIDAFMRNPGCVHFSVRLSDRYGDHGLVAILIAVQSGGVFEIDTWLMSCRVIGRTLEKTMIARLCCEAIARGVTRLRGFYSATARNELVRDLYSQLGFEPAGDVGGTSMWEYDLANNVPIENRYIRQRVNEGPNAADSSAARAGL